MLVVVDEPHGDKRSFGYATGGWVAAPVVKRFVARAAPLLGIAPQQAGTPAVVRALHIDIPTASSKRKAAGGRTGDQVASY